MEINSKQLNNHALFNHFKSFLPNNIFSPNQIRNLEYENYLTKNCDNNYNSSLKNHFLINYINNNNLPENNEDLCQTKFFKGGKIYSNYKYFQKTQNKHSRFGRLKTCKIFFEKVNRLNKSNRNSANDIFTIKISKMKKTENNLNRSCPDINKNNFKNINKYNENSGRIFDYKNNRGNPEIISPLEDEKNFSNKQSNIYKIEYIKKIIRKHYFENFDNLKEYFNNISGKESYINIEDIIFYLKEIIKVNIDKREIRKLLYINGIIKVDFNNFKFIFFPDLRNNKLINLKLKNEKCSFLKNKVSTINTNSIYNLNKNKSTVLTKKNGVMPYIKVNESHQKENINKSAEERSFQKNEIAQKMKSRGLNYKMKFLLIDINKDFILKRFNERYKFNKNNLKLDNFNKFNGNRNNINIYKKYIQSKRNKNEKNINDNTDKKMNEETNKNNKEKLQLFILKIDNMDINKIEEIGKNTTSNNNSSKEKKNLKLEDNFNSNKICDKLNKSYLNHKLVSSNRYLRNEIKTIEFTKNENESLNSINKISSFSINRTKEYNNNNIKRNKTISQMKENENKYNEISNPDTNKAFLFFNNENENEISLNVQNEKESKIKKNSDILNFL